MQTKTLKKSITKAVIILALIAFLPAVNCLAGGNEEKGSDKAPEMTTVTDMAGREVSLSLPADRIILASSRYLHEFAAVGGAEVLDSIAGWGSDLNLYDQDTFLAYKKVYPKVTDIPVVGHHYKGDFSVETVISLQPDVVVFPLWLKDSEGGKRRYQAA